MTSPSLNDIMNQMAEGLDPSSLHMSVHDQNQHAEYTEELAEFDAFIRLDETLEGLNKEYLDAKSQHDSLIETFGCDDAMAEIAEDVMDSAWCAMQTRYLEVRAEQTLMKKAQHLMLEATRAIEDAREKKALEKSIEQGERLIALTRYLDLVRETQRKENKATNDFLLAAIVLIFGLQRFKNMFFHFRDTFNNSFNQTPNAMAA